MSLALSPTTLSLASTQPSAQAGVRSSARTLVRCGLAAIALTLVHVSAVLGISANGETLRARYESLAQHDSYWFLHIIKHGYRSTIPPSPKKNMDISNVAFFPAFPLVGKFFIHGLALPPKIGLVLASQLATSGFWFYLLLLLRRWAISPRATAAACLVVAAHPASFYLIAGYSESLFLMMLLGYLFWSRRPGGIAAMVASLHGFTMTATRIAGVPAVIYPVVAALAHAWRSNVPRAQNQPADTASNSRIAPAAPAKAHLSDALRAALRTGTKPLLLSGLAALGAISFFIYCAVRFESWDFYMQTQQAGWRVKADYLALLKPQTYPRWWPTDWTVPWQVGQFSVPLTMAVFIGALTWEIRNARRRATAWRERAGLYFVGFALFFIAVSGVASVRLESMVRYQFCTHVFLVLAAIHALRDLPTESAFRRWGPWLLAIGVIGGLYLQFHYAAIFARGGWVA